MSCFQVRTDLALEARESITDADGELRGVRVEAVSYTHLDVYKRQKWSLMKKRLRKKKP